MKYYITALILIGVLIGGIWWNRTRESTPNPLDGFAKCLAEKDVTMYGANWCSHCQNEKKEFGSAFTYVPYVECPQNPKKCLEMGVEGYPTWILKDGRRLVGEQGIEKLAQESGCVVPTAL